MVLTKVGEVASTVTQLITPIDSTIHGLYSLKGNFKNADDTIRLLISQLSTIKAVLGQIHDWAEFNSEGSSKGGDFMRELSHVLDECGAVIGIFSTEVEDLNNHDESSRSIVPGIGGSKPGWSADAMEGRLGVLSVQGQALKLLLTASQCTDTTSQSRLLGLKENKKLLLRGVDDPRSEPQVSAASPAPQKQFVPSPTRMTVDDHVQQSEKVPSSVVQNSRRWSIAIKSRKPSTTSRPGKLPTGSSKEFYEAVNRRTSTMSSILSDPGPIPRTEIISPRPAHPIAPVDRRHSSFPRKHSSMLSRTVSDQFLHRWMSTSKPQITKVQTVTFPRASIVPAAMPLSRFNTSDSTSKMEQFEDLDSKLESTRPDKHSQRSQANQIPGFYSVDVLTSPAIVREAQAGSEAQVRKIIEDGEDLEQRHMPTKRTALAVACHCGNEAVVDVLIQQGAKVKTRDMDDSTPLHLAASSGHYNIVQLLLDENADIEARDAKKRTPFWFAAAGGHIAIAELLLKNGARVNSRADDQLTPLHAAAKAGYQSMTMFLLRNYAHIDARNAHLMTALHYASERGHLAVVDVLLQRGANIDSVGKDSTRPVILAAASGNLQIVELLTEKKASLHSIDDQGANALHWAARNGHAGVAEFLLQRKLSINTPDSSGLTPLHLAVIGSHFDTVELLLSKNAQIESRCLAGQRPLHYACKSDHADIVRILLSAGANAEAEVNGSNRRPIHLAAASASVETIGVLYQHGVEMGVRDAAGHRALSIACHNGHVDVVKQFLSLKQSLNVACKDFSSSDSPICVSAKAGQIKVIELLIRRGASVNQRDEHGFSPLRYAAYHGHSEVVRLLLDAGAEPLENGEEGEWGSRLIFDKIGFETGVTEERKRRVREMLIAAERRTNADAKKDQNYKLVSALESPQSTRPLAIPRQTPQKSDHSVLAARTMPNLQDRKDDFGSPPTRKAPAPPDPPYIWIQPETHPSRLPKYFNVGKGADTNGLQHRVSINEVHEIR